MPLEQPNLSGSIKETHLSKLLMQKFCAKSKPKGQLLQISAIRRRSSVFCDENDAIDVIYSFVLSVIIFLFFLLNNSAMDKKGSPNSALRHNAALGVLFGCISKWTSV